MLPRHIVLTIPFAAALFAQAPPPPPPSYVPTEAERTQVIGKMTELGKRVSLLRDHTDATLLADVEVYHKAGAWLLRHPEEFFNKNYLGNALLILDRGIARAKALEQKQSPWTSQTGRVALAYRSRVDGSIQPYAVVVPPGLDLSKPNRLDLVLHGRGATLTEVSFIAAAENARPDAATYSDRIELHVFGRTNNAYRWAGETDIFEALESVQSRYKIDPKRIVLRGFSMGGAGTWHIGMHHADRWAALEAGAGFNETIRYAKVTNPPAWVTPVLHIYDAMDWARNVLLVPTVGYGGDQDPQLRASLNIQEQLKTENLFGKPDVRALFLVGPNIGHKFHPDSKKESDAFLDRYAAEGLHEPSPLSFVTYTTRYNRAFRITVDALERHYDRAQVDANGASIKTSNVAAITVAGKGTVEIDGQKFSSAGSFTRTNGKWAKGTIHGLRKRHGLQGPIDDAFMDSFAVVRPSGEEPASMTRFLAEFAKWMRGDPRVLRASEVEAAQIRDHNLILFGDAASNPLIAKVLPKLPVQWNAKEIRVGGKAFPAAGHTLAMIYPNPLNPSRYVVLNTGHTFGEKEFRGTNALLYPRLGDWAVLDGDGKAVAAGLFNESWQPE
ncbi:MAG: prolyl oligopeptidase family serine peptidase [Bryobacteraceae bacterium]